MIALFAAPSSETVVGSRGRPRDENKNNKNGERKRSFAKRLHPVKEEESATISIISNNRRFCPLNSVVNNGTGHRPDPRRLFWMRHLFCEYCCHPRTLVRAGHGRKRRRQQQRRPCVFVVGVCLVGIFVALQLLLWKFQILSSSSNTENHYYYHYYDYDTTVFFNPPNKFMNQNKEKQQFYYPPQDQHYQPPLPWKGSGAERPQVSFYDNQQHTEADRSVPLKSSLHFLRGSSNDDDATIKDLNQHPLTAAAIGEFQVVVAHSPRRRPEPLFMGSPSTTNTTFGSGTTSGNTAFVVAPPPTRHWKKQHEADFGGLERIFHKSSSENTTTTTTTIRQESKHEKNFKIPTAADTDDDDTASADEVVDGQRSNAEETGQDVYYALDDDTVRGTAGILPGHSNWKIGNLQEGVDDGDDHRCRRVQDHRLAFPTCNEFHQMDYQTYSGVAVSDFRYINNGGFREVFSYTHHFAVPGKLHQKVKRQGEDKIAIKEIFLEDISTNEDANMVSLEYVRMDAIVAERLTASPRIYDIYGYCGMTLLSEFFYHGDIESRSMGGDEQGHMKVIDLHDLESVQPQNNLTAAQKLVLSLEMAQGLADLHGYKNALLIHDDVQLSQYLLNEDRTRLKLNDFNRAEFPLWDDEEQSYCLYRNGPGHGDWRSPEEYRDEPLTEAIDIWSLGNNMVGLLTGLGPFYELNEKTGRQTTKTSKRILQGETTYIDPRYSQNSLEEGAMVKIIKRCFEHAPETRPTIFEIVKELQQAVSELIESKGISRQTILQQL